MRLSSTANMRTGAWLTLQVVDIPVSESLRINVFVAQRSRIASTGQAGQGYELA